MVFFSSAIRVWAFRFVPIGKEYLSFFLLNRPLLPCGVEGFILVDLLDNW